MHKHDERYLKVMSRKLKNDLVGEVFGFLTCIGRSEKPNKYLLICKCGNLYHQTKSNLQKVKSCGCMKSKLCSESATKHGAYKKHYV